MSERMRMRKIAKQVNAATRVLLGAMAMGSENAEQTGMGGMSGMGGMGG